MKKFTDGRTDGRTDAEGYNIIRPFFKRAYKNYHQYSLFSRVLDTSTCSSSAKFEIATDACSLEKLWQEINPLYTGGLFHCYILDESICHFRGVRSIFSLLFYV